MKKLFQTWFRVDSRSLAFFRILLGWLCVCDIIRRWNYIDVFYSDIAIKTNFLPVSILKTKQFSIFYYLNSSLEVTILFLVGLLFSIFLMIGYKTKLSHFITTIIIISIHNKAVIVENAGDFVLNCMLVWTFFLPLGSAISLDSLKYSLKNDVK